MEWTRTADQAREEQVCRALALDLGCLGLRQHSHFPRKTLATSLNLFVSYFIHVSASSCLMG